MPGKKSEGGQRISEVGHISDPPAGSLKRLLEGTGMKSPRQAFGPKQRPDFDERVENSPPRFWQLRMGKGPAI